MNTEVKYVDGFIANRYEENGKTIIEMNQSLKEYPKLHDSILKHELEHESGDFTLKDLNHDINDRKVNFFELIKFIINNPKSLMQFLPFYKHKEYGWVKDNSLIFIYSIIIVIFGLGIYISLVI